MKSIMTKNEYIDLINEVDYFRGLLYKSAGKKIVDLIHENCTYSVSRYLENELKELSDASLDKDNILMADGVISKILLNLKNYTEVKIIFAVEPGFGLIQKIYNKLKPIYDGQFYIDLQVNKDNVGGFEIYFNDKYYDYSFKTRLNSIDIGGIVFNKLQLSEYL